MTAPEINVDELIAGYIKLRDGIDLLNSQHKDRLAPLNKAMEQIEGQLMDLMNKTGGLTQLKSSSGTAFITTVSRCGVANWDLVREFVETHGKWDLLNKAVNKTAVQEYINANSVPPPGVNWSVAREIQIRRPS